MVSVIFLISGGGGNLKFIKLAADALHLKIKIQMVIADRLCGGWEFAQENNIPARQISYSTKNPWELDAILSDLPASIVVTNMHKILALTTLNTGHRFINLHYSILPTFKGLIAMKPVHHARALNSPFIGVTTHDVIEEVDSGKILQQGLFRVDWSVDNAEIEDTVFQLGAIVLLNTILEMNKTPVLTVELLKINNFEAMVSNKLNFDFGRLESKEIWHSLKNDSVQ